MATYSVVEIPSEAGNPEWRIILRRDDGGAETLLPTTYGSDAEAQQVAERLRTGEPLIVSARGEARGEGRATATGIALFVPIDHTSPANKEGEEVLEKLADAIRGSNDLFADADERLTVSTEVQGLREIMRGTKVRVAAVLSAIKDNGVIALLAREGVNTTIRYLAIKVLEWLWTLIP